MKSNTKNKNSGPTNQIAATFSVSVFFYLSLYACVCWWWGQQGGQSGT